MLARALNKSAQQPSSPGLSGPWSSNSTRYPQFAASLPIGSGNRLTVEKPVAGSAGSEAFSFSEDDLHFDHSGSPPSTSGRAIPVAGATDEAQIVADDVCNQDLDHDLFLLEEETDGVAAGGIPLRTHSYNRYVKDAA